MSRGLFNTFGMPHLRVREHAGGGRGCGRELGMLWGNWGCCCVRQEKRSPASSQDFLFSLCNHQQNSLWQRLATLLISGGKRVLTEFRGPEC